MLWRDLEVWQRAHSLVLRIYKHVQSFPREERYRLTDQLCRAAMSVPANIVEGQSRQTTKEYIQFCIKRGVLWRRRVITYSSRMISDT